MEPSCKGKKMSPPHETGILDIPNEVLQTIFMMLSQKDSQQNVALVCRRFLQITRSPNFVQNMKIQLNGDQRFGYGYDLEQSCWQRVKKVLKIYPQCKIELYHSNPAGFIRLVNIIQGFSWMNNFRPFAISITKMTLRVAHNYLKDFSDIIMLQNLEYPDMTIQHSGEPFVPQDLKAEFWNKFPKLKSLKFSMNRNEIKEDDFDKFTISISSECQDLERFEYYGYYRDFDTKEANLEMTSTNKNRFSNLKYIKAEFTVDIMTYERDWWKLNLANLEKFKNYLTIKCPKLENPIQIDLVTRKDFYGWRKTNNRKKIVFESK